MVETLEYYCHNHTQICYNGKKVHHAWHIHTYIDIGTVGSAPVRVLSYYCNWENTDKSHIFNSYSEESFSFISLSSFPQMFCLCHLFLIEKMIIFLVHKLPLARKSRMDIKYDDQAMFNRNIQAIRHHVTALDTENRWVSISSVLILFKSKYFSGLFNTTRKIPLRKQQNLQRWIYQNLFK